MRYQLHCCAGGPLFKAAKGAKMIDRDRPAIRRLRMKMRMKVKAFLKAQAADIADQVVAAREALTKGSVDEIKAILAALTFEEWGKLIDELGPLLRAIVNEGAAAGLAQLKLDHDIDRMLSLVNEFAVNYANTEGSTLITNIAESTRSMIRTDVARALESGDSNQLLASTLRDSYAFSPERAEMIARTETALADVEGNIEAYKQAGVVAGKQWITGAGCCDLCDELDGTIVDLGDEFPNEGGNGPPLHPNCRCDVLPVLTEEN